MAEEILAEFQLRAYVTVLVRGPAAAWRAEDLVRFQESAEVVGVTDFYLDDVVEASDVRRRWSNRRAHALARHDDLFHALFW